MDQIVNEEMKARKERSDKGQPRKRRSKDLTLAVRVNNAILQIETALTVLKDLPADFERFDAMERELATVAKRFIK